MPRRSVEQKPNRYWMNTPVCRGSTVAFSTLQEFDAAKSEHQNKDALIYGRLGTPTTFALEAALAEMENGYAGLAVSSGLSAVTISLLAFLHAGDHLLVADSVYGPTRNFCDNFLRRIGVAVTYYDPLAGAAIEELIRENTRCIYMESPGSLTFEVQDVPALVAAAARKNIVTIMDNTWAGSCFYQPLDHGVNVSVISATKYIAGHSDAMLGMIVSDRAHYDQLRFCRTALGSCVSPDDSYLGLRGAKTLRVRMRQHQQSALELAAWLQRQEGVLRIIHPAFPSCPGHAFWQRDFSGSSSLFSFEIEKRSRAALAAFLNELDCFSMGLSWGGCDSLIIPADPQASRTAVAWESEGCLLRVYAGLENTDDLKADLEAGLHRYRRHA